MLSNGPVGFPEMAMISMIQGQLETLAKRPHWIRFLLGQLTASPILARIINVEYIDRCVSVIQSQKIEVVMGYKLDQAKLPCISVLASPAEDQQYIGRVGHQVQSQALSPVVYARFTATSISGDEIEVSREYKLQELLWKGVLLTNGIANAQIDAIVDVGGPTVKLLLKEPLADNTSLTDWRAQSSPRQFLFDLQASLDEVTWQIVLHTNGTAEEHRLFATIVRVCLKRGRDMLDLMGYKEPVISQTPIIPAETNEPEWQTQFTVRAKYLEHWIAEETELADPNPKLIVDLYASPDGGVTPERQDVLIEEDV